jgi:hypothetical protein
MHEWRDNVTHSHKSILNILMFKKACFHEECNFSNFLASKKYFGIELKFDIIKNLFHFCWDILCLDINYIIICAFLGCYYLDISLTNFNDIDIIYFFMIQILFRKLNICDIKLINRIGIKYLELRMDKMKDENNFCYF